MFTSNAKIVIILFFLVCIICMTKTEHVYEYNSIIIHYKKREKNIRYIIALVFFLFLGICVKDTYDIGFYRDAFIARISHRKEPLFDTIQFFFHDIGWNFDDFKILWIAIITILLFSGIKKYCTHPEEVVALSFISVLLSYITQMRSALACAVILNASALLFTGKKKDRVIYGIIVMICAQLHIVSYAFLLFLLIGVKKRRKFKLRYFIIIGIFTVLAVGMNSFFVEFVTLIVSIIPALGSISTRIIASINGVGTPWKAAIYLIMKQLLLYFVTDRACIIQKNINRQNVEYYDSIRELNTIALIFIPISIINASFLRVYNLMSLIQFSMILNVGRYCTGLSNLISWKQSMKAFLICFCVFSFMISIYSNPEDYLRMVNSIVF